MRPASLSGAAMEALIENVVIIPPPIEALRGGLAVAEETSLGPEGPSYSDADEKAPGNATSAPSRGFSGMNLPIGVAQSDVAQGFSPEDSSESSGSCSGGVASSPPPPGGPPPPPTHPHAA